MLNFKDNAIVSENQWDFFKHFQWHIFPALKTFADCPWSSFENSVSFLAELAKKVILNVIHFN